MRVAVDRLKCADALLCYRLCKTHVQVKMAIDLLRGQKLSLLPLDDWVAAKRRRKAQEEAEMKELDAAAQAQVGRPRQRWCIGSGTCIVLSGSG